MNCLKLTREKLSVEDISDQVSHESCGAISFFVGTTRDNFQDKKVISLEYEAYEPMAVKQMERICHFIRERWSDVKNIAIYHRLGTVPVREASVVIAISSQHREAALDAVSYAIEELKKLVPIWKKEKYDIDESVWKENKECKKDKLINSFSLTELALIPEELVQITVDDKEINRRIKSFVKKKREEIDMCNIADYTACFYGSDQFDNENESTCARTNSILTKQKDSSCHIRVRRVKNRIGPQITEEYLETLSKLMSKTKKLNLKLKKELPVINTEIFVKKSFKLVNKRLFEAEKYLNIAMHNRRSIYQRIKAIENRLLYLESLSPEYKHFLKGKNSTPRLNKIKTERKIFYLGEMDSIIGQLKQNDIKKR